MIDKISITRNYILDRLELGELDTGARVPSTRDLAKIIDISYAKVQQGINSLMQDGVLESKPRSGTFVRSGWQNVFLRENLSFYSNKNTFPWLDEFAKMLGNSVENLRIQWKFLESFIEIRPTLDVQNNHEQYMDLSEIFDDLYPDKSSFFTEPFKSFYLPGGKLSGIPFIFSPRVIFYNPKLFKVADCSIPQNGWTWDDFLSCIDILKKQYSSENAFFWNTTQTMWINFIVRAGGCLFDDCGNPYINSPETQRGLRLFADLKEKLGGDDYTGSSYREFMNGNLAMLVGPRQLVNFFDSDGFTDWATAPLPIIPGGRDTSVQATDLICVRKNCPNIDLARKFIRYMLSSEFQDFIGQKRYGIPIRKSSAAKSIDMEDSSDVLFMYEMPKMTADYNIDSPELYNIICDGVEQILRTGADIVQSTDELQNAIKTLLKIKKHSLDRSRKLDDNLSVFEKVG